MHTLPQHIAIIMDGNGRWAKSRFMPRTQGHRAGAKAVKRAIECAYQSNIQVLTLYALSVENLLHRPAAEVDMLLKLFVSSLTDYADELHKNNIRVRMIGDFAPLSEKLVHQIDYIQTLTQDNTRMTLVIALNYSGRWDITQAANALAAAAVDKYEDSVQFGEAEFSRYLSCADLPDPDLLIRTSGELRISNFLLWQLAYSELYFTDILWPDFDKKVFEDALLQYQQRNRRFGLTQEQLKGEINQ